MSRYTLKTIFALSICIALFHTSCPAKPEESSNVSQNVAWETLPPEFWNDFFVYLNYKPKTPRVWPQSIFTFKKSLEHFLYKRKYRREWIVAARELFKTNNPEKPFLDGNAMVAFLVQIDQRTRSNFKSPMAYLSYANLLQEFQWKGPCFQTSRDTYTKWLYLVLSYYDVAGRTDKEARSTCQKWIETEFRYIFYDLCCFITSLQGKSTPPENPKQKLDHLRQLIDEKGTPLEKQILEILQRYM